MRPTALYLAQTDQVSAVLRDAEQPMTAKEIGQHVGSSHLRPCRGDHWHTERMAKAHSIECQGDLDLIVRHTTLACGIQRSLETLLRAGQVTREKVGRSVYWTHVPSVTSAIADQLAGLWTEPGRA